MTNESTHCALVIGASSAIAQALILQLIQDPKLSHIYAVSRKNLPGNNAAYANPKVVPIQCDNSEQQIIDNLSRIEPNKPISLVFICNGMLHSHHHLSPITPEKRLEDINPEHLMAIMQSNLLVPLMWVKHLVNLFSRKSPAQMVIFSARVGSIEDNRLGGWYSYRASKAALNMMIKNAAIEYSRRAKQVKIIAFHPGTTDTPLSQPFQANVSPEKLFTPDFVASQLLNLLPHYPADGQASFIDWQGKTIKW